VNAEYTVKSVRPGKVYDRNEHGQVLQAFYVDLQGPDGKIEQGCYWRRKEGNNPEEGQSVFGEVSEGDYGPRFKQAKGGGGSSDYGSRSSGAGNFKGGGKSPDQQASIVRQHSQEMCLRWLEVHGHAPDGLDGLRPIIDWFEADANKAASEAGGKSAGPDASGSASAGAPPTAASPQTDSSVHQRFTEQLEAGGLNPAASTLVTNWVFSDWDSTDEQDRALKALEDPSRQAGAVKKIRGRYEGLHGPLPEASPYDEDIPF